MLFFPFVEVGPDILEPLCG
jgi:hypothetical protein